MTMSKGKSDSCEDDWTTMTKAELEEKYKATPEVSTAGMIGLTGSGTTNHPALLGLILK